MSQFTNQSSPGSGTALSDTTLNPLVVAQSCLLGGTAPTASGAASALTVPAQQVVINNGNGTASYYSVASAAPSGTITNNATNYIDAKSDGTGFVWSTAGSAAGTNLRLYSVAVNSGGTVTAVANIPTYPIGGSMIQTGTAGGVPGLDTNLRVIQPALTGVRQFARSTLGGGDITFSNGYQTTGTSNSNWQQLSVPITLSGLNNSTVIVFVSANVSTNSSGGNWLRLGTYFSGPGVTNVVQLMAHTESIPGYNGSNIAVDNLAGFTIFTGLSGTQTFPLCAQAGGGVGQNVSCRQAGAPGLESITYVALEVG